MAPSASRCHPLVAISTLLTLLLSTEVLRNKLVWIEAIQILKGTSIKNLTLRFQKNVNSYFILYIRTCHRIPGIVMDYETHGDKVFYKVAVRGGFLNISFLRTGLNHEYAMTANTVNLDDLTDAHWPTLPKISIREAVKNISLTGDQGHIKCSCTTGCTTTTTWLEWDSKLFRY